MSNCLDWAIYYAKCGYSIIPVRPDKRPWLAWTRYQQERADEALIRHWWDKWPQAGVGIVTGAVSGLVVVDMDTEEAHEAVDGLLPESCITPIARTQSGGYHYYFKHPGYEVGNSAGRIEHVDVRGDGGYVVAPPTNGEKGKYAWQNGTGMGKVPVSDLPESLVVSLNLKNNYINNCQQKSTSVNISFEQGHRDQSLFHVANSLVKGGMSEANMREVLAILSRQCKPPYPDHEIEAKIESAMTRAARRERNIAQEVRDWVLLTSGDFLLTLVDKELDLLTRVDKLARAQAFQRLMEEGIVERASGRRGHFRTVSQDVEPIDFIHATGETLDVTWPLGIESLVQTMPGNIIIVAGAANSGKTAFMLNVVRENQHKFDVHYFSSEMAGSEFRKRLSKFDDMALEDWKFKPWDRSVDFADVIRPDGLNIIDYLELHDNFWLVGQMLKAIYDKLKKGIAVVGLQKNPGQDAGLGGQRSLEKARLALALDAGECRIVKAKNWATDENPNGLVQNFKLVGGCKFIPTGMWYRKGK